MRINREFATELARRLCDNAMRIERAALKERQAAVSQRVLEVIYDGKREMIETLGEPWVRRMSSGTFHLRDGERYASMQLDFGEEVLLPSIAWHGCGVSIKDKALMDEIMDIHVTANNMWRRNTDMHHELITNINKARSVKKLLELWPEAAEDIVAVAKKFDGGAGIEVPLTAIFKRYNTALLPAPTAFEIVEVTA